MKLRFALDLAERLKNGYLDHLLTYLDQQLEGLLSPPISLIEQLDLIQSPPSDLFLGAGEVKISHI